MREVKDHKVLRIAVKCAWPARRHQDTRQQERRNLILYNETILNLLELLGDPPEDAEGTPSVLSFIHCCMLSFLFLVPSIVKCIPVYRRSSIDNWVLGLYM